MKQILVFLAGIVLLSGCTFLSSEGRPTPGQGVEKTIPLFTRDPSPSSSRPEQITTAWYKPKPGTSWQWQLSGDINTSYDVDVYDIDLVETPQAVIDELHNDGKKVICYFSAGTREDYRDDADLFPKKIIGKTLEDWDDEQWLDVSNFEQFAPIMQQRLDVAVVKKCDGVEPDNIDGYQNDTGFNLSYQDQLRYNTWLAQEAHKRNLAIGLKNDLDQVKDLAQHFDFAVNEECFFYKECDKLLPFIAQKKAVLGVEYNLELKDFCPEAKRKGFSWLKMDEDLGGKRAGCTPL